MAWEEKFASISRSAFASKAGTITSTLTATLLSKRLGGAQYLHQEPRDDAVGDRNRRFGLCLLTNRIL